MMKLCGARTQRGTSCGMRNVFPNGRCIWHGGKSTGPRTPQGRQRVAQAQKRRWAKWRAENPRVLPDVSDRHERRVRQRYNTMLAKDPIKGQQVRVGRDRETSLQELAETKFPPGSIQAQVRDSYPTHVARQKREAKEKADRERLRRETRQWLEELRGRADAGTAKTETKAWVAKLLGEHGYTVRAPTKSVTQAWLDAWLAEINTAAANCVSAPPTDQPQHVDETPKPRQVEPAPIPEHHLRRLNRDARRRAENERGRELMARAAELRGRPTTYRR